MFGHEMAVLWKATGKFPAMVGMDMAYYSQTSLDNGGTGKAVDKALEAWENNSIVTLCWHWLTPRKYISGNWYSTFYKENTTISLDRIMDGEDEEGYRLLEQDMDLIAKQLKILADAEAYKLRVVKEVAADASYFDEIYAQYSKNKKATLVSLFSDTLAEAIAPVQDKFIVDVKGGGQSVLWLKVNQEPLQQRGPSASAGASGAPIKEDQ